MPNDFSLADIASIQTAVPNPYAPAPSPVGTIVEPAKADFSLSDVVNVKAAAPTADFLPSDVVSVAAAAPRVYTPDFIKATPDAELLADKDFIPVNFGVQNFEALQSDPALRDKLVRLYQEQEAKGTTAKEKLKSVFTGVPEVVTALKKGAVAATKAGLDISPQGMFVREGGIEKAKQSAAELAASVETAGVGSSDLIRRSLRSLSENTPTAVKALPPFWAPAAVAKLAEGGKNWNDRFFDDVAGAQQVEAAGKANGAVMSALGFDAASLKEDFGITVNPETINELSAITDPINFVPLGGAVGVVSKVGGKIVTRTVAVTGNAARAAALAKTLNAARDAVASGTGNLVAKVGGAVEAKGAAAQKLTGVLGGAIGGLGIGSILGHDIYSALGGAVVVKGVPAIAKAAGKATKAAGEMIAGTRAVPGALQLAADTATGAVGGFVKGTAEGAILTLPFEIGARPDEEQFLLGAAGLGGVTRGGIDAVAPTARATGRVAQNKLAETIFKRVEQADPAPDAGNYGTDANLDSQHASAAQKLQPAEAKLVNWARALLRAAGGEVYVVPGAEFKRQTGYDALGYAVSAGERVGDDGVVKPVFRILLNETAESLPHEFYHALESLDPKKAANFKSAVASSLTPEQRAQFAQLYNSRINGGKPEKAWTLRLSEDQISSEVTAEVFSRLLLAQDLSGVAPGAVQKGALFVSGLLEKLGAPLGGIAKSRKDAGVSNLGVRPSAEQVKTGQAWLNDLIVRVNDTGTLGEPPKFIDPGLSYTLTPEEVAKLDAAEAPAPVSIAPEEIKPVTVAPPPAEIIPTTLVAPQPVNPPSPKAPAIERRNIRTTRAAQDDFTGQRAEVTNVDKAVEAATEPKVKARVEEIAPHLESGVVLEIVHQGATAKADASPRSVRRAEQEASYIAAAQANAPRDLWDRHQKVFVPVRFEIVAGKPQLLAMSMDKVLANAHQVAHEASMKGVGDLIPYKLEAGRLTDSAWNEFVGDLQSYNANQANGYRGDGAPLTRPDGDAGLSIPAENPAYTPVQLPEGKALFLNLVQGLNPPLTAREVKGSVPGNVKGQILAEINERSPAKPAVIRPSDISKQTFSSGREIMETNPLRNELAAAGVDVRELIEVTERINVEDIETVTPRPDLNFDAPVTDTIRGGFLPHDANPDVRAVAEDYAAKAGIKNTPHTGYDKMPPELGKRLADFYEQAESNAADPAVKASYQALATETLAQLNALEAAGYTVEPFTGTGEPYANSAAAVADIRDNKHLYFLKTEGNINAAADNPMLAPWRDGLVVNDAFRAVHDFFGHGKEGYQFGPRGEFNAWKAHAPMFSDVAQGALAAETLAQNAWVNFGPNADLPVRERPFAEQKNIVVPPELIAEAKGSGSFLPTPDEVSAMSAEEFNKAARSWPGGQRNVAYELGLNAKTEADVAALKTAQERASADRKRFMAAKDLDNGVASALKAQFFREAYEAATDTGGAAGEIGWRSVFPERTAPFPQTEGAFLPGRKLSPEDKLFRKLNPDWEMLEYPPETNLDDLVIQPKSKAKPKTGTSIGAAAWILPDGEVRSFKDAAFHEQDLAANSADYNKRFGTDFSSKADAEDRLSALNAGFVRVRNNAGGLVVEAAADRWDSLKPKVLRTLKANADNIAKYRIALLDKRGNEVDSVDGTLGGKSDREGTIAEAVSSLRAVSGVHKGPTDIQRARSMGDYLPADRFSDEADPIVSAAIRTPSGEVYSGPVHSIIAEERGITSEDGDGFITRSGKFLNREEALAHALKIKQLAKGSDSERAGYLEVDTFKRDVVRQETDRRRGFLPAETFYSELQKVVEEKVKGKSVKVNDLGNLLRNSGVKAEEIKWSGLDDFTRGKESVDTELLKQWLRDNDVRIEEVVKGTTQVEPIFDFDSDGYELRTEDEDGNAYDGIALFHNNRFLGEYGNAGDATARAKDHFTDRAGLDTEKDTKFENYQVPGGENYKELLLTLPTKGAIPTRKRFTLFDANDAAVAQGDAVAAARWRQENKPGYSIREEDVLDHQKSKDNFISSHWDNQPNVLAHVRFNERTDAEGKRVLFVEEVQSDWHQKGRNEGYKGEEKPTGKWRVELNRPEYSRPSAFTFETEADANTYAAKAEKENPGSYQISVVPETTKNISTAVPDAPFKKTWPLLAVKRMIRYAAEANFDKIAWTPGDVQAERYDLSKQVDSIQAFKNSDGKTYDLSAYKDDSKVVSQPTVKPEDISDLVGKDLAKKILAGEGFDAGGVATYTGDNLKVGGEGMRGFYDEILPKEVGQYVKKWGSKVEKKPLLVTEWEVLDSKGNVQKTTKSEKIANAYATSSAGYIVRPVGEGDAWSLPITPEMKTDVLTKGQKKFLPVGLAADVEVRAKSTKKNISVEIRARPVDRDEE